MEKIIHCSARDAGVENYFYKLPEDFDYNDARLVKDLFKESHPYAQKIIDNYIRVFLIPWLARNRLGPRLESDPHIAEIYRQTIVNAEEALHAGIENSVIQTFAQIRTGNVSFYDSDDECRTFILFLCMQYFRTKPMRERIVARGIPEKLMRPIALISAANLGASLFVERKNRQLLVTFNASEVSFITGEQTVINLLGGNGEAPPTSVALYCPISPQHGLFLSDFRRPCLFDQNGLTADDVRRLNDKIAKASNARVFGATSAVLERYV